jgi:hypothetical protein
MTELKSSQAFLSSLKPGDNLRFAEAVLLRIPENQGNFYHHETITPIRSG